MVLGISYFWIIVIVLAVWAYKTGRLKKLGLGG